MAAAPGGDGEVFWRGIREALARGVGEVLEVNVRDDVDAEK